MDDGNTKVILEHVRDLIIHIRRVQDNAFELATLLIDNGEHEFARVLLSKVSVHDASKWHGIEWDCLHCGSNVEWEVLSKAIEQHQKINDHHPEYWGGFQNMPEICIAEMVCDWLARSQEFATDLREWIKKTAAVKYEFKKHRAQAKKVKRFVDLLLPVKFVIQK